MSTVTVAFDEGKNKVIVYSKEDLDTSLATKVDKVEGKGLSTEDYTTEEKAAVATIANKQDKHFKTVVTLSTTWTQISEVGGDTYKHQLFTIEGITKDSLVMIRPYTNGTAFSGKTAMAKAFYDSGIYLRGNYNNGNIDISYLGDEPTIEIQVEVIVFN